MLLSLPEVKVYIEVEVNLHLITIVVSHSLFGQKLLLGTLTIIHSEYKRRERLELGTKK